MHPPRGPKSFLLQTSITNAPTEFCACISATASFFQRQEKKKKKNNDKKQPSLSNTYTSKVYTGYKLKISFYILRSCFLCLYAQMQHIHAHIHTLQHLYFENSYQQLNLAPQKQEEKQNADGFGYSSMSVYFKEQKFQRLL